MATPAQRTNTWTLDQWYDQSVAGTTGGYVEVFEFFGWGNNGTGQLAQNNAGSPFRRSSPTQIPGTNWANVNHSRQQTVIAAKDDGTLWSWGGQSYGDGGRNNLTAASSPVQVGSGTDWSTEKRVNATGHNFSMYVKNDGTMWSAGRNNKGQLGLGHRDNGGNNSAFSSPCQVLGTGWSAASCTYDSALGLRSDGTMWSWGSAYWGKLGLSGPNNDNYSSPVQLPGTSWSKITGNGNFAALKTGGELYTWGFNREGQLGHNTGGPTGGSYASVSSPKQIPGTWRDVSSMREGCYGVKTDGTLWAWGRNQYGELGLNQFWNPTNNGISSPTQVGSGTDWKWVSSGTYTCYAQKTDGSLWSWGRNLYGDMGVNLVDVGAISSPMQIGTDTNWLDEGFNGSSAACFALKST